MGHRKFEKYFMAHQYMPKLFHDPHKCTVPFFTECLENNVYPKKLDITLEHFNIVFATNSIK